MGPIIAEAIKDHPQIADPGRRDDVGIQDRKTYRLLDPVAGQENGLRFSAAKERPVF